MSKESSGHIYRTLQGAATSRGLERRFQTSGDLDIPENVNEHLRTRLMSDKYLRMLTSSALSMTERQMGPRHSTGIMYMLAMAHYGDMIASDRGLSQTIVSHDEEDEKRDSFLQYKIGQLGVTLNELCEQTCAHFDPALQQHVNTYIEQMVSRKIANPYEGQGQIGSYSIDDVKKHRAATLSPLVDLIQAVIEPNRMSVTGRQLANVLIDDSHHWYQDSQAGLMNMYVACAADTSAAQPGVNDVSYLKGVMRGPEAHGISRLRLMRKVRRHSNMQATSKAYEDILYESRRQIDISDNPAATALATMTMSGMWG